MVRVQADETSTSVIAFEPKKAPFGSPYSAKPSVRPSFDIRKREEEIGDRVH